MGDKFTITILPDGTIKTETDKVSMPNHQNAEMFIREMGRLAGGETTHEHKHGTAWHSHGHDHAAGQEHHH